MISEAQLQALAACAISFALGRLAGKVPAAALALADRFRGAEGAQTFNLLFELLADRVHAYVAQRVAAGAAALDPWAAAWETLQPLPREVEAVNLDRADALFSALAELRQAARS